MVNQLDFEISEQDFFYINCGRIERDVDRACSEISNSQIQSRDIQFLNPTEANYASIVIDYYGGYEFFLDEKKLIMTIRRKH